jgi:riboflavin biosynthesis pyrimidine reductase
MADPELARLDPAGPATTAAAYCRELGLWDDPGSGRRPRVVAAMVGSADGRATVHGSASGLGSPADRSMLRELRTAADALLVGPSTLIAERYATVLDAHQRERRTARGRAPEPLVATISRRLDPRLADVPLLAEPQTRMLVLTESEAPLASAGADLEVARFAPGALTGRAALEHLAGAGARVVLTEGGPSLLHALIAEGLVDDLVLTLAPALVAGEGRSVLHGPVFDPPVALRLADVLRGEDHLFLRYVPVT